MAKVIITESLFGEIHRKFNKSEAHEVIDFLETLEEYPKKGKELGTVGGVVIKELKFKKFRFYFVTDGHKLKFLKIEELKDLIIKAVKMSEKKDQQKTINEIKQILRSLGEKGFK